MQSNSNHNKTLPSLPAKNVRNGLGLVVDTSFSQHRGKPPQQIYPHPDLPHTLSTFHTHCGTGEVRSVNASGKDSTWFQRGLGAVVRVRDGPQKVVGNAALRCAQASNSVHARVDAVVPEHYSNDASVPERTPRPARIVPAANSNKASRRPPPLKLASGISPSDRAIPIGIAVPSATMLDHRATLESAVTNPRPHSTLRSFLGQASELKTPTIVITPAEEDFSTDFHLSPLDFRQPTDYRPRSSVYSKYNDCSPNWHQDDQAPPVPPMPQFATIQRMLKDRKSKATRNRAYDLPLRPPSPIADRSVPAYTDFDKNAGYSPPLEQSTHDMSLQSQVVTSRQSRGWWNVITSPFSSSPAGRSISFRSPPIIKTQGQEGHPILAHASDMGFSKDIFFASRTREDNELRSAPATDNALRAADIRTLPVPKRSDTAPAALDLGNASAVNIYRIPSGGEASSYYDSKRNYDNLALPTGNNGPGGMSRGVEQGRSPLDCDRAMPPSSRDLAVVNAASNVGTLKRGLGTSNIATVTRSGPEQPKKMQSGSIVNRHIVFDSPSEEEFDCSESRIEDSRDQHDLEQDTIFTPQSPTPVLENAHTAHVLRPTTSNRDVKPETQLPMEQHEKQVFVNERRRPASPEPEQEKTLKFADQYDEEHGSTPQESDQVAPGRPLWRRSLFWELLGVLVFSAAIATLLVLLLFPLHRSDMAVEAQWLNLTTFPPLPTGVLTVVGPKAVKDVSSCVSPSALWSCDVPPGQSSSTTGPNKPNFRFLIRFRNGTTFNGTLPQTTNATSVRRGVSLAAHGGELGRRAIWSDPLYASSPPPPSANDQIFIGQTTDENSLPYNGEQTPFYISLLDPVPLPTLQKRSTIEKRHFHYPYPTPSEYNPTRTTSSSSASSSGQPSSSNAPSLNVPSPKTTNNNEPTTPELYPFAYAQPLRLFNRGQSTEHYGFYTYFDRTIYLSSASNTTNLTTSKTVLSNTPLDQSTEVCTWSQTRFLVQIWTQQSIITTLTTVLNASSIPAAQSTANDMVAPGSFPYPVTVTLDRHGGNAAQKGVYCYSLDAVSQVMRSTGTWVAENRAFGGTIVDPAVVPTNGDLGTARSGDGGSDGEADGGTGGCTCQWRSRL